MAMALMYRLGELLKLIQSGKHSYKFHFSTRISGVELLDCFPDMLYHKVNF